MAVELELTDKQATLIWCRLQRGRDNIHAVLERMGKGNITPDQAVGIISYNIGFMDADLTWLASSAPSRVKPDGNESDKP